MSMESDTFFYSLVILTYFNLKYYVVYMFIRKNSKSASIDRKLKLSLTTLINLLHIFFYFLTKEEVIRMDGCGLMRTFFLLIKMWVKQ